MRRVNESRRRFQTPAPGAADGGIYAPSQHPVSLSHLRNSSNTGGGCCCHTGHCARGRPRSRSESWIIRPSTFQRPLNGAAIDPSPVARHTAGRRTAQCSASQVAWTRDRAPCRAGRGARVRLGTSQGSKNAGDIEHGKAGGGS